MYNTCNTYMYVHIYVCIYNANIYDTLMFYFRLRSIETILLLKALQYLGMCLFF